MEENITRTPFYGAETVYEKTFEQPIDADFTLPEYYPDTVKILKCCCMPYVVSKGLNGNYLSVEGTAVITVIYCDEDSMLNSYEYSYPFSKSVEMPETLSEPCVFVSAETEYINCRAVSARKIDIHGALNVSVSVTEIKAKEIISEINIPDVVSCRQRKAVTVPVCFSEKYLTLEEEIEIGSAAKEINCIIRYDANPVVLSSKLMANKAMIKGELAVNLLYCDSEGEIIPLKERIPFSQLSEVKNYGENNDCDTDATLAFLEIKPKSDAEGKLRSFTVNAKILTSVKTSINDQIDAVVDAYSRKFKTEIVTDNMTFCKITEKPNDNFIAKSVLEFTNEQIMSVTDLWCNVKTENVEIKDNSLVLEGKVCVSIIAADDNECPNFYEREFEFSEKKDLKTVSENSVADAKLIVRNCGYTLLSGGDVEVRAEININASVYDCETVKLLSDIKIDRESKAENKANGAMIIYFASAGENLWNIASRYLADVDEIKKINDIKEDVIVSDKMLLIPN